MIDETAPVLHRAAHIGSRSGAGPEPEMIAEAQGGAPVSAATGESYR
ncbi:hypothetical protein ABZS88_35740 [Streptomyces sp. NPDC005480]